MQENQIIIKLLLLNIKFIMLSINGIVKMYAAALSVCLLPDGNWFGASYKGEVGEISRPASDRSNFYSNKIVSLQKIGKWFINVH